MGAKRNNRKKPAQEDEEDVDYGATADRFAELSDSADNNADSDVGDDPDDAVPDSNANDPSESEDDADETQQEAFARDYEEQNDVVDDVSKEEEEDDDDDDDDDDDNSALATGDNDEDEIGEGQNSTIPKPSPISATGEQCSFDLRNLVAVNSHQVDISKLYKPRKGKCDSKEANLTIPPDAMEVVTEEAYLLEKALDGCSQLIGSLWQLPVERSDAGPLVKLPSFDASRIPRALPPPPPKKETRWEKFAKERGLSLNKEKRSRKVWDEASGTWKFRHGYDKANDDNKDWPIMEVKGGQDPYEDPWEKQREAKQLRKAKNTESRLRNEERAGNLAKGTTTRIVKSKEKIRQAGKKGGEIDRVSVPPTGVPVDLRPTKADGEIKSGKRGKVSTLAALKAAQRSTASLGKFDKIVEGEPERKVSLSSKKRKFESNTDKKVTSSESERSMKVFKAVIEGGGAEREKARQKGKLSKGETAYDYEFDDGLGPSSFKKKKGRAGAGKAKKMTKKRVK